MFDAELNSNASTVEVDFCCDNCHEHIAESFSIPLPDFSSERDTHEATRSDSFETISCPNCGKEYNVQLISSTLGSWLYIHNLPDDYDVTIDDDEDITIQSYTLMHKDIATAELEIDCISGSIVKIGKMLSKEHLPIRAARTKADFKEWWNDRAIPRTRRELKDFLASRGVRSTGNYLVDNLGLSLIDCYWIKPESSDLCWNEVNLFVNSFQDSVLSKKKADGNSFSPDASTGGDLPKRWVIEDGIRYLLKGNEGGTTQQSRNEVPASLRFHEGGHRCHGLNGKDNGRQSICRYRLTFTIR